MMTAAATLLAGSLLAFTSIAPANAAEADDIEPTQNDIKNVVEDGGVVYKGEAHFAEEGSDMTITLQGGTAQETSSGDINIYNGNGKFIEALPDDFTVGDNDSNAPSFDISEDGQTISVTFDEIPAPSGVTTFVDQDCAAINVFYAAGGGALAGVGAGPAGVVVGSMTGLLTAGVQSAIHC